MLIIYHDKKKFDSEVALIQDKKCEENLERAIKAFGVSGSYEDLKNNCECVVKPAGGFYDQDKLYELKLTREARLFFCFKSDVKQWCITQLDLTHSVNKKKHNM